MSSLAKSGGLFLAAVLLSAAASGDTVKEFRKSLPLDADGSLTVDTYKGSITVTTSDAAEVSIEARIEPDPDGEDQAEKVRATEIRVRGGGRSVEIETDYDEAERHGFFRHFFGDGTMPLVHYTIRMPATARLEIRDYKSETRIAGLRAALKLETYKGTVRIERQDGELQIDTYKGDVEVGFARFSAPARVDTYKGDVALSLPASSGFEIDADIGRRGDLSSDFDIAALRGGDDETVTGKVGGGGPRISFETYKGRLRLRRS